MHHSIYRRAFCTLAAAFVTLAAQAQAPAAAPLAPPKYAVMSLIGKTVNVVLAQQTTGSRIDRNRKQSADVPDTPFDAAALRQIDSLLRQAEPGRDVALFNSLPSAVAAAPASLFAGDKLLLAPSLLETMRSSGATQLLLITRHRQEAHLQAVQVELGQGRLDGVGFYVDRITETQDVATREVGLGFLAGYVNLKVSLVDLASGTVLAQQVISRSTAISASQAKTGTNPWDTLTWPEKITLLDRMISNELKDAVTQVLKSS